MKHIKFLFVLFLLGVLGCQRISEEDSQRGEFVIHARTEGGEDTKTSLSGLGTDGMYHALWAAGDVITVYADGSTVPGDFTLTSGAGTDRGTFSGATAGSSFIGFYPSSMIAAEGWQSNVLTINLPQEQAYAAGTFAPETFPMIAVGSASNLTFKNLCAILKVSITGEEQVNSIEFKPADASKIVSGKATIQSNYGGGNPQLVMAAGGANTVTLNCGAVPLSKTTPTDFFLVIPPGTYSGGFSLDINTFRGTVTKTTTQDITFERSQLRAVPAFECVSGGEDDPNNVPYNQIWYVSTNGDIIEVDSSFFDAEIVSNVYGNGKGVITFSGPITRVERAFRACDRLREIIIPEGVTYIADDAFSSCENLEYVTLPSTITISGSLASMMYRAYADCPSLKKFLGNSPAISDGGNCLMGTDYMNGGEGMMYAFAGAGIEDYVIPEGVTSIQNYVFCGRPSLRSLTFPHSLLSGPEYAIEHCDNLEFFYGEYSTEDHTALVINKTLTTVVPKLPAEYTTPEGIVGIGYTVFSQHPTITKLTVGEGVKWIEGYAFSTSSLKELILPSSLEACVRYNPFISASNLEKIYFKSYLPPTYSDTQFHEEDCSHLTVYVPEESLELYKNSSWSQYAPYMVGCHYDDIGTPDYYVSTDFSHDGEVTVLQTASAGNGINLVLMGDAYSDRQIANGTYATAMNKMMDAFFSEEPYTTFQNLFNVYAVTVVSSTEGYDHAGHALSTYFDEGTHVGGDDSKCMEYAQKAIPSSQLNNSLIIVAMNRDYYAGTCYMYYPSTGDYGDGVSVAYFPTSSDDSTFKGLVRHEAGGHGFAKLGDEYAYEEQGAIPQSEIDNTNQLVPYGWWKNVDFTGDPSAVKWAHFLSDGRYQYDGLGCFQGACTYWTGAWRPTVNSIMRHNTDGFNAPSREAIYYRINKLAYGADWEYSYEDFVAYDAVNRKSSASAPRRNYVERRMEPTHAPVVVGKHWWEVARKADDGILPAPGANHPVPMQDRPEGPVSVKDYR